MTTNRPPSVPPRRNNAQIWTLTPPTLADALQMSDDPEELLQAVLVAARQYDIEVRRVGAQVTFHPKTSPPAESSIDDPILSFTEDGTLQGSYLSEVELAYQVIRGIEGELSSVILLPPEVRRIRVSAFCNRIGISEARFGDVLRNWSRASSRFQTSPDATNRWKT